MCFCLGSKHKSLVEASAVLSAGFVCSGVVIFALYICTSIFWKIECESYNNSDSDGVHMECGTYSMWGCVGWAPTLLFIVIASWTANYICKQSTSNIKVINSSRAWVLTFVTVLAMILFFIHWCYIIYIMVSLSNNKSCKGQRAKNDDDDTWKIVDCQELDYVGWCLFTFASLVMIYVCCALSCLFGIVNGAVATPIDRLTEERIRDTSRRTAKLHVNEDDEEKSEEGAGEYGSYYGTGHNNNGPINLLGRADLTPFRRGDRVIVQVSHDTNEAVYGTVQYYGRVPEYPTRQGVSFPYIYGVELDQPKGNNNGKLGDTVYFDGCPEPYGIFVMRTEIQPADPGLDPMQMFESTVGGVTIGRGNKPNHFVKRDLTELITHMLDTAERDRKKVKRGVVRLVTCATVKRGNARKVSRELLDLVPHVMLSALHYRSEEQQKYLDPLITDNEEWTSIKRQLKESVRRGKRMTTNADLNGVLFNTVHGGAGVLLSDALELSDEEDRGDPHHLGVSSRAEEIIHFAYLELPNEWHRYGPRLVDPQYVDWSAGMDDGMTHKWVLHNQAKATLWLQTLLGLDSSEELNVNLPSVRRLTRPRFSMYLDREEDEDIAHKRRDRFREQCLYVPFGFFASGDTIMDLSELPRLSEDLYRDETIHFEVKNLVHEPVERLEELAPFWRYELYEISDDLGDDYGWFPVDFIYVELELKGKLASKVAGWYDAYERFLDNGGESTRLSGRYNPFYMLRFPRIPLCYLATQLPLKQLGKHLRKMDSKRRKKRYGVADYHAHDSPVHRDHHDHMAYGMEDEDHRERMEDSPHTRDLSPPMATIHRQKPRNHHHSGRDDYYDRVEQFDDGEVGLEMQEREELSSPDVTMNSSHRDRKKTKRKRKRSRRRDHDEMEIEMGRPTHSADYAGVTPSEMEDERVGFIRRNHSANQVIEVEEVDPHSDGDDREHL